MVVEDEQYFYRQIETSLIVFEVGIVTLTKIIGN